MICHGAGIFYEGRPQTELSGTYTWGFCLGLITCVQSSALLILKKACTAGKRFPQRFVPCDCKSFHVHFSFVCVILYAHLKKKKKKLLRFLQFTNPWSLRPFRRLPFGSQTAVWFSCMTTRQLLLRKSSAAEGEGKILKNLPLKRE